jgi:predicted DNA-binding transcriptional regulator AlpA
MNGPSARQDINAVIRPLPAGYPGATRSEGLLDTTQGGTTLAAQPAGDEPIIDLSRERQRRARPTRHAASRTYMTVADFCAVMDVARSTFYDWRAKRMAPRCIKLPNGELRIRRAEFERWLDEREERAA